MGLDPISQIILLKDDRILSKLTMTKYTLLSVYLSVYNFTNLHNILKDEMQVGKIMLQVLWCYNSQLSICTKDDSRTVGMLISFHSCVHASNISSVGPPNSTKTQLT